MPRNRLPNDDENPSNEPPPYRDPPPYEVEKVLEILFDDGQWFRIPKPLLAVLSPAEAVVLAYLINQSQWNKAHLRRKGKWRGWFYCRIDQMEKDLHFPARKQQMNLRELRNRGFVRYRRRGIPAKRFFKINWHRIVEVLENSD